MPDDEPLDRDLSRSDLTGSSPSDSSNPPDSAKSWTSRLINLGVVLIIAGGLIALLLPNIRSGSGAGRRAHCLNNLYNITRALLNYESSHGHFPPAYTTDADGKPLHSWRTLILPYMDRRDLYDSIDLTKTWDDPANAAVFARELHEYRCPGLMTDRANETTYLAVVTPESCLRVGESRSISKDSGAPSLTLLVIEVDADHAVPWMQPVDADEDLILQLGENSRLSHPGGMNAAFADGSVQFLPADLPAEERRALITIAADDNAVIKIKD